MDNNENYSVLEPPLNANQYDNYYNQWLQVNSYEELQNLIKEQTKDMTNLETISFISQMTGKLPYNSDKAKFKQNGDTQKPDNLWNMIQEEKKAYAGFDQAIGIKKERNLYEWSALPSNVKLTPNAVRAGLSYRRDLGNKKAILLNTNYTGTQVGGMYNVTTSYQMGKHQVFINYQDKAKGINKNIQSNLLPNVSQRISAGYGAKDINIFGAKADIGANITYLPKNKDFFVGGKIKFNINAKKKKRKPSSY